MTMNSLFNCQGFFNLFSHWKEAVNYFNFFNGWSFVASHFSFDGLMSRRWASRQSLEKFCDRNSLGNKDSLVVVVNTIDVRSSALKFLANCVTNELTFISFHKDSLVDCISISCWLEWCYLNISSSFLYKSFLNRWRFLRSCIIR